MGVAVTVLGTSVTCKVFTFTFALWSNELKPVEVVSVTRVCSVLPIFVASDDEMFCTAVTTFIPLIISNNLLRLLDDDD